MFVFGVAQSLIRKIGEGAVVSVYEGVHSNIPEKDPIPKWFWDGSGYSGFLDQNKGGAIKK